MVRRSTSRAAPTPALHRRRRRSVPSLRAVHAPLLTQRAFSCCASPSTRCPSRATRWTVGITEAPDTSDAPVYAPVYGPPPRRPSHVAPNQKLTPSVLFWEESGEGRCPTDQSPPRAARCGLERLDRRRRRGHPVALERTGRARAVPARATDPTSEPATTATTGRGGWCLRSRATTGSSTSATAGAPTSRTPPRRRCQGHPVALHRRLRPGLADPRREPPQRPVSTELSGPDRWQKRVPSGRHRRLFPSTR